MLNIIFILLSFCNQKIDTNAKIIQCNTKINLKEFKKLKKFKKLEILDLSNSNFSDIKHIKNLKELKCLSLENTKIQNLKGIGELNKLIELDIRVRENNIKNYSELEKLNEIQILQLNKFNKKDLSYLLKLKKLFLIQTFHPILKEYLELSKINEYNFFIIGRKRRCVKKIVLFYLGKLDKKFDISLISFIKDSEEFKRIIFNACDNKYKNTLYGYLNKIIIKYLVKNADINKLDKKGESLLDYAWDCYELANFLKKHGALRSNDIIVKKEKEKLLNHYLKGNGKSYQLKGIYWDQLFKDRKYIRDFIDYAYKYSRIDTSIGDSINIDIGKITRSCSCNNEVCILEFEIHSNIELLNKHENLNLKLKAGNNFQVVYKLRSKSYFFYY